MVSLYISTKFEQFRLNNSVTANMCDFTVFGRWSAVEVPYEPISLYPDADSGQYVCNVSLYRVAYSGQHV